jgi:hypothetical protein
VGAAPDRFLFGAGIGKDKVMVSPVFRLACDAHMAYDNWLCLLSAHWNAEDDENQQRQSSEGKLDRSRICRRHASTSPCGLIERFLILRDIFKLPEVALRFPYGALPEDYSRENTSKRDCSLFGIMG